MGLFLFLAGMFSGAVLALSLAMALVCFSDFDKEAAADHWEGENK